jgi:hypothetical protein
MLHRCDYTLDDKEMWLTFPYLDNRQNTSPSRRGKFLHIILFILLAFSHPQLTTTNEHVIFEQIGLLAGSTAYLHAHITVSVSSIEEQLDSYESLLRTDFSDYQKVHNMIQLNLGNVSAHINTQDDVQNFSSSKMYMAAVSWTKMAKLHLEEISDIRDHTDSLRNLLPDRPVDNVNRVAHNPAFFEYLQYRINQDSYIPDDASSSFSSTRRLHSYDDENPRYQSSALGEEEENIPFPFKITPFHEAGYRILKQQKSVNRANAIPDNIPLKRQKRVAGLLALPIGIAATAMGIYNAVQIKFLKTELLEEKENVKRLFEVVQCFDKELNDISGTVNISVNHEYCFTFIF